MRTYIRALYLPKAGNTWDEYEDAWAWGDGASLIASSHISAQSGYTEACILNEKTVRAVVADGASDAFEARLWAQALVGTFIQFPLKNKDQSGDQCEEIKQWLELPIQTWKKGIPWDNLPYYAEEKAGRGSFSTFMGVTFSYPSNMKSTISWQSIAVGDSCLFQIRNNNVLVKFPINQSKDFGVYPPLISTQQDYNCRSLKSLNILKGECQPGDLFILSTDALAAWFLEQLEMGEQPWQRLKDLNWEQFIDMIENLRQNNKIRNDDMTLLLIWLEKEQRTILKRGKTKFLRW